MIGFEVNFGSLKGGQRLPANRVKRLMKATEQVLKLKGPREVSIAFVNATAMKRLNESYYGGTGVTDVLAFPSESAHWSDQYLGEILIYYPKAARQAKKRGVSTRSEVELLLVHGLLHLLGYNHDTERRHKEMFGLQDLILEKAQ